MYGKRTAVKPWIPNVLPSESASMAPSTRTAPSQHSHNTCTIPGMASRHDQSRSQAIRQHPELRKLPSVPQSPAELPPPYTTGNNSIIQGWAQPPDGGIPTPTTSIPKIYRQQMKEHKLARKTTIDYFTRLEQLGTLTGVRDDTTDTRYMVECIKTGLPPIYLTTILNKEQYIPSSYDEWKG
ncbi:uncharacterized protein BT62DRAFT_1002720 [Guyanagaster necrorhizus]|uniref:Uncharacterized protein n=1 Tax=Guyanagaster necrorhizus TaxID=856835 RepID=A0A9P8AV50_9AGAR|nr:uncharacterized protein BT62DRAFT_1002720 [Guyanagaster necrorhizus MCA 3950]KAG7449148.1 hypothetical protein BT62DRAFT_1002720 [Guyanagaster necrorhizus MCA 3950]